MKLNIIRAAVLATAFFALSTTNRADLVLFYEGSGYDSLADPPLTITDIICGAVTFPTPLPTTDGASIAPSSVVLQTSENGGTTAGFFSSAMITNIVTWNATNGLPDTWVLQVGVSGVNQLQVQKDMVDEGDTASLGSGSVLGLGSVRGTWSNSLSPACSTGAHPVVAAVPEPSAFLSLSLLVFTASTVRWWRYGRRPCLRRT